MKYTSEQFSASKVYVTFFNVYTCIYMYYIEFSDRLRTRKLIVFFFTSLAATAIVLFNLQDWPCPVVGHWILRRCSIQSHDLLDGKVEDVISKAWGGEFLRTWCSWGMKENPSIWQKSAKLEGGILELSGGKYLVLHPLYETLLLCPFSLCAHDCRQLFTQHLRTVLPLLAISDLIGHFCGVEQIWRVNAVRILKASKLKAQCLRPLVKVDGLSIVAAVS